MIKVKKKEGIIDFREMCAQTRDTREAVRTEKMIEERSAREEEEEVGERKERETERGLRAPVRPTAVFREARNYAARPPRKRGVKIALRSSPLYASSPFLPAGTVSRVIPRARRPLSKLIFY